VRFLVDAQLPPALAEWFGRRGHDATHVSDLGLLAATDGAIADRAARDGLVLVSKDEDFVVLRLPDRFALLWLRVGNATNRALLAWLEPRWPEVERLLTSGERFVEVR
jgi:predicted nuclease of predicted toxin-antitoxin system